MTDKAEAPISVGLYSYPTVVAFSADGSTVVVLGTYNGTAVEIRPSDATPVQLILEVAGPLLKPLATAGIVLVFVIFFLLQRQDLRDRFIRLAGAHDLRRTTQALDDAAHRLSRYLLIQTGINAGLGVLVGTGLWFIGVPNPALWGAVASR